MRLWSKTIPWINLSSLAIYLVFVFGIDLYTVFQQTYRRDTYWGFWKIMLLVLAVYLLFFWLESFVLKKKFASTTSRLDGWVLFVIIVRNVVFLLNFIPLIQLLGLVIDIFAGWAIVITYIILIYFRYRNTNLMA